MNSSFIFKKKFTLDKRKEESSKIREKYSDKIPIIVEARLTGQYDRI